MDTIDITETSRLVIKQDTDAENPRKDWDMLTGFVKIDGRGDWRILDVEPVHDDPIRIAEAHDRLVRFGDEGWTEDTVERWARIFHGMHIEYDSEHGGYWFVDNDGSYPPKRGTLEEQARLIASERETYRQWAEGEVYGVTLQRVSTWAKLDDYGRPITMTERPVWEDVDSLYGCYLDNDYTAEEVALESFDLTDEERDALRPPERREPKPIIEHTVGGEW
jgi:hypothetical protein